MVLTIRATKSGRSNDQEAEPRKDLPAKRTFFFFVFLDIRSLRRVRKIVAIFFGLCLYVSSWPCDLFYGTFFLVDRNATPDGIRY
jgi:hypothetical protein